MNDRPAAEERDARRGIQSVEIGFQLVRELAKAHGKLPLKTLAERAGMTSSKAHLYLVSFLRLGLVTQDASTSRYGLGPAALELGIEAINQLDVVDLAREYLPPLIEETGTSFSLSVWGNRGATIIYRLDTDLPVPLSVRVGYVLPLLTTATGRTFMAHLPEREWSAHAAVESRSRPAALTEARASLERIRSTGVAVTQNQTHAGFFGVSCPVFDSDNTICATITALGLSQTADLSEDGQIARAVIATSTRMSRAMGATRPLTPAAVGG